MKTAPQQPNTRQQSERRGRIIDASGKLILDTETGFRDEEGCALLRQRMLEAGYWQIVRTEAPK